MICQLNQSIILCVLCNIVKAYHSQYKFSCLILMNDRSNIFQMNRSVQSIQSIQHSNWLIDRQYQLSTLRFIIQSIDQLIHSSQMCSEARRMFDAFLPLYSALVAPRLGFQDSITLFKGVSRCCLCWAHRTFNPVHLDCLYTNPEDAKLACLTALKASSSLRLCVLLRPTMIPVESEELEQSVAHRILTA